MIRELFAKNGMTAFKVIAISVILAMVLIACAPAEPEQVKEGATLAIEHFSVIEGTTWSGAHDRAGKRIAEKYPNVEYVYREEVGPDLTVPFAEELITDGASIVVGNAEFMGLPLKEIAEEYPDGFNAEMVPQEDPARAAAVAALVPGLETTAPLYTVLSTYGDFFSWWGLAVLVIGFQRVFGMSRNAATVSVLLPWALASAVPVGLGILFM